MNTLDFIQVLLFLVVLTLLTPILGNYMSRVFSGSKHFMLPVFRWLEKIIYRFVKVNPDEESNWKSYAFGLLLFNLVGFVFLFLIQIFQSVLPMNPVGVPNVSWHSAFIQR